MAQNRQGFFRTCFKFGQNIIKHVVLVGGRGVSVGGKKGKLIRVLINPHARGSSCKKKTHKLQKKKKTKLSKRKKKKIEKDYSTKALTFCLHMHASAPNW